MKILISFLILMASSAYAGKSCVPTPNETMCIVVGGKYDAKTKMCCIETKKAPEVPGLL